MALEHVHSSYGMSGGFRRMAQPFPRIPPRQDARITPGFHPDNLALPAPGQAVAAENVVPDVSRRTTTRKSVAIAAIFGLKHKFGQERRFSQRPNLPN